VGGNMEQLMILTINNCTANTCRSKICYNMTRRNRDLPSGLALWKYIL